MSHVLFAVFDHPEAASKALEQLQELGADKEGFSFIVHRRALELRGSEEMPLSETAAASGLAKGAMFGALGGLIVGTVLAGPLGLIGAGPIAAAVFGTTTGTAIGSIAGLFAGVTEPDTALTELVKGIEDGKLVVSVEARKLTNQEQAETILKHHGAHVVHRHVLRGADV
jgi:uncharacterized membrane protein